MQYRRSRLAGVAALVVALGVGACEKQVREANAKPDDAGAGAPAAAVATSSTPPAARQAAPPAPASAVIGAAPKVAETRPAATPTFLTVDGVNVQFPPTKLLLHEHDGGRRITAELFSDLPKSALRNYAGNDLYLEMDDLAGATPGKLDGATWRFKSAHSGKADTTNGIFLNGQATHLQPFDVWVRFIRGDGEAGTAGGPLMCEMIGQFRAYEAGTPDALAPSVGVSGALPVEIVKKR